MAGQLIVSISAISDRTVGDVAGIGEELQARSVPASLLTAPRLKGGYRVLDHLGLRTRLFAAPGWAVSPSVMKVLPRNGFRLVAEMSEVTDLVRGTAVRARVLGIGEGFISEPWWCRTLVLAAEWVPDRVSRVVAPHLLRPGGRTRRRTGHRLKTAPSEGDAQLLPAAHC